MSSQFEELFKARKEEKPPAKKKQGSSKKNSPTPPPPATEKKAVAVSKKKKKPSVAKSDRDSDFEQTLVYLKKDTKLRVKISLLEDPEKKDFSDLVEELLTGWLKKKS